MVHQLMGQILRLEKAKFYIVVRVTGKIYIEECL